MEVLQNSQKFRVLWHGRTELTEVPGRYKQCCSRTPGIVARGVHNSHRTSMYAYERHAELTEVQSTGIKVLQNSQKFRVLWHGRTELREVPCRYKNAVPVCGHAGVQNLQKFRVWV